MQEAELGRLLGQGTFCSVHEVKLAPLTASPEAEQQQSSSLYALKRLRTPCVRHGKALAKEAHLLSHLPRHENILTLRAISEGFWEAPEHGFLVLDLLKETLRQAISAWKYGQRQTTPAQKIRRLLKRPSSRAQLRREEQADRIRIGMLGLARAMQHLHEHQIIFRDLKPENAAFDESGKITLFDFGISETLEDGQKVIHTKSRTGTSRYLAPEIIMRQAYGLPSDVHSFAMCLFEVCVLEKPFSNAVTDEGLFNMLVKGKIRPSLWSVGSPNIVQLLTQCWDSDPIRRPGFSYIVHQLEQEVRAVENNSSSSGSSIMQGTLHGLAQ